VIQTSDNQAFLKPASSGLYIHAAHRSDIQQDSLEYFSLNILNTSTLLQAVASRPCQGPGYRPPARPQNVATAIRQADLLIPGRLLVWLVRQAYNTRSNKHGQQHGCSTV